VTPAGTGSNQTHKEEHMRKYYFLAAALVAAGWNAQGQEVTPQLHKGTHELTLQGFADFEESDDFWYFADVGYGYFLVDGFELGLSFSLQGSDDNDRLSIGPFVEYNFLTGSQFVPFVSFGTQWVNAEIEIGGEGNVVDTSTDALLLDGEIGVKTFLRDNIAISTGIAYEWATDDVFGAEDDVDDGNGLFKFGMRFYL
jgi:hypothetical protein